MSRNTRCPARASVTSRWLMSAWAAEGLPPRLPAYSSRTGSDSKREDAGIDQRIVHDHVGLLQAREHVEGQEAGIARARAGEPDVSRRKHRDTGTPRCERIPGGHGGALPW